MSVQIFDKAFQSLPKSLDCCNYVIRPLESNEIDMVVQLLADRFSNQSPFNKAYYQKTSEKASSLFSNKMDLQRSRFRSSVDEYMSNKMSVGCFSKENDELVGVSVVVRFGYSSSLMPRLMEDTNYISAVFHLQKNLLAQVPPKYHQILSVKNKIINITAASIKENHAGKGILPKLLLLNQMLASEQGYQYSFVYSVNFKTNIVLRKLGYQKMTEIDAWEFQLNGVRYFERVEQVNRMSASLWIKNIGTTPKL